MPEPRGNERHHKLMRNLFAANEDKSVEELNALMQTQLSGPIDDMDYPSENALRSS